MAGTQTSACTIDGVGVARNGRPRFWCTAHGADATGVGGPLERCAGGKVQGEGPTLRVDPRHFAGGIALWGSVPAIYDTTGLTPERGVHVHARRSETDDKEIDDTYDRVEIVYRRGLFDHGIAVIDGDAAIAYYLARFAGTPLECVFCTYCGKPHTDQDEFAVRPHRKHLCDGCGRYFYADHRNVSNALALLDKGESLRAEPELSSRSLHIRQADFAGGIQLWASNPAIVWLADRPEEAGIHVHALNVDGERELDDTYGSVTIDGLELSVSQAATLMAQKTASWTAGAVRSLNCPTCHTSAFDEGRLAFEPRREHTCLVCGGVIRTPGRGVVANPLVDTLDMLRSYAGARG